MTPLTRMEIERRAAVLAPRVSAREIWRQMRVLAHQHPESLPTRWSATSVLAAKIGDDRAVAIANYAVNRNSDLFRYGSKHFRRKETRYVSAAGVEALVNSAKAEFVEATGAVLPWNLDLRSDGSMSHCGLGLNYGPGGLGRFGRRMPVEEASKVIAEWARFAGWLRAAKDHPALSRMISKTQGGGLGAKATKYDLWAMAKRWPSPGRLERLVRATRKRGDAVLSAYTGSPRVSWKGIALGLMAERSVGKAAITAAAVTLGAFESYATVNYRAARAALVDLHQNYPLVREDDGVRARTGREPFLVDGEAAVYAALFCSRAGQVGLSERGFLVSRGSRTYHVREGYRYSDNEFAKTPAEALSIALAGWERQDYVAEQEVRWREQEAVYQQAAEERERIAEMRRVQAIAFLSGEQGFTPLFTREDSRRAGNCSPGTDSWVLERGWRSREFVPGTWLIPFLQDERVQRVVLRRMQEHEINSIAA